MNPEENETKQDSFENFEENISKNTLSPNSITSSNVNPVSSISTKSSVQNLQSENKNIKNQNLHFSQKENPKINDQKIELNKEQANKQNPKRNMQKYSKETKIQQTNAFSNKNFSNSTNLPNVTNDFTYHNPNFTNYYNAPQYTNQPFYPNIGMPFNYPTIQNQQYFAPINPTQQTQQGITTNYNDQAFNPQFSSNFQFQQPNQANITQSYNFPSQQNPQFIYTPVNQPQINEQQNSTSELQKSATKQETSQQFNKTNFSTTNQNKDKPPIKSKKANKFATYIPNKKEEETKPSNQSPKKENEEKPKTVEKSTQTLVIKEEKRNQITKLQLSSVISINKFDETPPKPKLENASTQISFQNEQQQNPQTEKGNQNQQTMKPPTFSKEKPAKTIFSQNSFPKQQGDKKTKQETLQTYSRNSNQKEEVKKPQKNQNKKEFTKQEKPKKQNFTEPSKSQFTQRQIFPQHFSTPKELSPDPPAVPPSQGIIDIIKLVEQGKFSAHYDYEEDDY